MFRYLACSWTPGNEVQCGIAKRIESALRQRGSWRTAFKKDGHSVFMTGHSEGVNEAYVLPNGQGVILGRIFRRGRAAQAVSGDVELSNFDGQRIVHSSGRALIEHFWGRYVAFLPSATGEARVLRDPTGALPCYRLEVEGVSVVLSWLEDLLDLLPIPTPSPEWEAVAAHALLGQLSAPPTALDGVTQILAGELTPMNPKGNPPLSLWNAADFCRRPPAASPAQASRLLRATIDECVHAWASCYATFVLRLSGGVDSSMLLGTLADEEAGHDFICLNYYSTDPSGDERAFARLAAQQHGTALIERAIDESFQLDELMGFARTPVPVPYVGSMATSRIDAEVADGHHAAAVFNGAGGDPLFFEVQCTWPAADYLKQRGIDRGFPGAVLDAANLGRVSFWRALRLAVKDRNFEGNPLSDAGRHLTLLSREAKDAASQMAHRYVHPSWLAAGDLPIGKFHQLGMLVSPLEYYNQHLRERSPERVHPLMSQPLLEFCLSTPTFVLTHGGRGRGLARAALADRLPTAIARRRSKGRIEHYAVKVLQRNQARAREMLLDGLLAAHGLLDRHRVELALSNQPGLTTTPASEVHSWIAIEAWLRVATAPSRAAPP
jgi:asparagine synthase (glutamine-hydrolysing)